MGEDGQKNGRSRSWNSAASQEWIDEMSCFFACLGKLKVTLVIIGWLLYIFCGTLKSGVSHKWFDELSRLIELFFHADSDGIIFGLTANLLFIFDI